MGADFLFAGEPLSVFTASDTCSSLHIVSYPGRRDIVTWYLSLAPAAAGSTIAVGATDIAVAAALRVAEMATVRQTNKKQNL